MGLGDKKKKKTNFLIKTQFCVAKILYHLTTI